MATIKAKLLELVYSWINLHAFKYYKDCKVSQGYWSHCSGQELLKFLLAVIIILDLFTFKGTAGVDGCSSSIEDNTSTYWYDSWDRLILHLSWGLPLLPSLQTCKRKHLEFSWRTKPSKIKCFIVFFSLLFWLYVTFFSSFIVFLCNSRLTVKVTKWINTKISFLM